MTRCPGHEDLVINLAVAHTLLGHMLCPGGLNGPALMTFYLIWPELRTDCTLAVLVGVQEGFETILSAGPVRPSDTVRCFVYVCNLVLGISWWNLPRLWCLPCAHQ